MPTITTLGSCQATEMRHSISKMSSFAKISDKSEVTGTSFVNNDIVDYERHKEIDRKEIDRRV